ncbi:MAG: homoserine kinase [Chthoniobacterales bacterium]
MQEITVRVPASTSNLGPGFDCLGVALRIYNRVTVRRDSRQRTSPMLREAADLFFERARLRPFRFACEISGEVPQSRGLGSSAAVRLGLLDGLNGLANKPLMREEIFRLCAKLEGHPDNAAPAEFGGFNVIRAQRRQRFPVAAALKFILVIPDFEVRTAEARALLPDRIARHESVESCANACAITAAFASGKYQNLRGAFHDYLHQPYRKKLLPFFDDVVAAAENAGALGGFISGSGSTIAAVSLTNPAKIAAAMGATAPKTARILVTTADNRGAQILP